MTKKKDYQRLVNAGVIVDIARLIGFAAEQGLVVTRLGSAYLSVKDSDGRGFRLYLAHHWKARQAGMPLGDEIVYDFWIYALVAQNATRRACYIGQTRNVARRMREHWKRRTGEHGSRPLFDWATENRLPITATLLQALSGNQDDADRAEAEWLARATAAGYELPDVEVWAPRKVRFQKANGNWPSDAVRRNSQSLSMVACRTTSMIGLAKNSELKDDRDERLVTTVTGYES